MPFKGNFFSPSRSGTDRQQRPGDRVWILMRETGKVMAFLPPLFFSSSSFFFFLLHADRLPLILPSIQKRVHAQHITDTCQTQEAAVDGQQESEMMREEEEV
jgi:hypothetical protein